MAVFGPLGYITLWKALTISNGTTQRALSYTTGGMKTSPRIYTLPNGVKVNQDGTSVSPTTPGIVKQEIIDMSGTSGALIDAYGALLGQVGALIIDVQSSTGGTYTASAVLIGVEDTTPVQGSRGNLWITFTWDMLADWALVV